MKGLFVLMMLGSGVLVGAQAIVVEYAEGDVTYRSASNGPDRDLLIGADVPPDATIDLGDSGYAELRRGSSVVRIVGPGSFAATSLFGTGHGRSSRISSQLGALLFEDEQVRATVAGVRGDFAGESDWGLADPVEDLSIAAADAMAAGDAATAVELYRELQLYNDSPEYRLELVRALLASAEVAQAVTELDSLATQRDPAWAAQFFLLSAQAAGLQGNSGDLVAVVAAAQSAGVGGRDLQAIGLTAAESLVELGHTARADAILTEVVAADPDTALAVAARRIQAFL